MSEQAGGTNRILAWDSLGSFDITIEQIHSPMIQTVAVDIHR